MSKPFLMCVELRSGIGIRAESRRNILKQYGTVNVMDIHYATQKEIEWVRAMGGFVPEGRIHKEPA